MSSYQLKPADAASYLDVSISTLNRMVKQGRITPIKISHKTIRFTRSSLDAILNPSSQTLHSSSKQNQ